MVTEKLQGKFICKSCDYSTSNRSNWKKHIMTPKHKNGNNGNKKVAKKTALVVECVESNTNTEVVFLVTKKVAMEMLRSNPVF